MALPTIISFTPSTTISSADVNANFAALRNRSEMSGAGDKTISSTDGHILLDAGTSKVVKLTVFRVDNGSGTYQTRTVLIPGWNFKLGDATSEMEETISIGQTLDNANYITIASRYGTITGSDPVNISDLTSADPGGASTDTHAISVGAQSTTQFTVNLKRSAGTFGATTRPTYGYLVIGKIA